MSEKKKMIPLLCAALAAGTPAFAETPPAQPVPAQETPAVVAPAQETMRYTTTREMMLETLLTAFFLEKAHILQEKIAGMDMAELLDSDCYALDPTRSIFLQSDVDALKARFAPTLSDYICRGNLHAAFTVYEVFTKRLEERVARIEKRLARPESFNLERADALSVDLKNAAWPADLAAADELWEKRLTNEIITELLGEKDDEGAADEKTEESAVAAVPAEKESDEEAHPSPEAVAAACAKLRERYAKLCSNLTLEPWEVEEIFLNALTTQYDPHTAFFSKQSMEEFEIMMRNSLCGIGAVLSMSDGYCTVREVMPGSPVERSGKISVGDRIVAVGSAEEGAELTDVVGMRLNRIVRMLRGKKGVPVRLLVESGSDRSRQLVTLVRDEIKLTEQLASAQIFDVPAGGETVPVGVISLPSFYGKDRSADVSFSTSEDVKELLKKLKAANVRAIVLDLRRNGGGYLNEAVDLLELFVGSGVPVLQTQGAVGRPSTLRTGGTLGIVGGLIPMEPEWTGPVVVLVSKLSASASEIVAGALQDNRRALVVGDPQTHGKGSVQEVIPFKAYDAAQEASIKLTRSKWYAPSGNSIQIKGVSSDIVAPSVYSVLPVGEGDLDRPLPWDSVPSVLDDELPSWLSAPVSPELISALEKNSRRRQAELPEFLTLNRTIAWVDEREKTKEIPLSLRERLAMRDEDKVFSDWVKNDYAELKKNTGYRKTDVKLDAVLEQEKQSGENAAQKAKSSLRASNPAVVPGLAARDDEEEWPDYDVLLREAVRIAADWVEMLDDKENPAAGTETAAARPAVAE